MTTIEATENNTRKEKQYFSFGSIPLYRPIGKNDDIKDAVNIRTKKGIVKMMPITENLIFTNEVDTVCKLLGFGVHQLTVLFFKSVLKELEGKKNKKNLKLEITL